MKRRRKRETEINEDKKIKRYKESKRDEDGAVDMDRKRERKGEKRILRVRVRDR